MSIDKAVENAMVSVQMEGYEVDDECIRWCKQLLRKEISYEQYLAFVKQKSSAAIL